MVSQPQFALYTSLKTVEHCLFSRFCVDDQIARTLCLEPKYFPAGFEIWVSTICRSEAQVFRRFLAVTIAMTNPRLPKRQKTSLPDSINSFTLLPIAIPSLLQSVPPAVHIIYLQRHLEPPRPPAVAPSESSRTIFAVNVPIDCTKELLRGLLASLGGRLEEVCFREDKEEDSLPYVHRRLCHSGGTAHVTFPTSSDADKIFKSIAKERKSQSGAIREWGVGVDLSKASLGFKRTSSSQLLIPRIPDSP
jgi:Rrp7 RRM-like N-terminal domain